MCSHTSYNKLRHNENYQIKSLLNPPNTLLTRSFFLRKISRSNSPIAFQSIISPSAVPSMSEWAKAAHSGCADSEIRLSICLESYREEHKSIEKRKERTNEPNERGFCENAELHFPRWTPSSLFLYSYLSGRQSPDSREHSNREEKKANKKYEFSGYRRRGRGTITCIYSIFSYEISMFLKALRSI